MASSQRDSDLNASLEPGLGRLFDTLRDGVVVADISTGRILLWNRAAARIFGYTREHAVGRPLHEILPTRAVGPPQPEDIHHDKGTGAAVLIDEDQPLSVTGRRSDGSTVTVEMTLSKLADSTLGWDYALAILREQPSGTPPAPGAAAPESVQLEAAARSRLLGIVAHELKSPVTVIKLQLDLLRRSLPPLGPQQERSFEVLDANASRIVLLAQDLIDVAFLTSGRFPVRKEPMDLREVATSAASSMQELAAAAKVRLTMPGGPPMRVLADPQRIAQLVVNLVGNGVKFTPPLGEVVVEVEAEDDRARLRVRDNGIGFTPDEAKLLFQPFRQAGPPAKRALGSGLGLYICRLIAEAHDGSLEAWSEGPGRGASFTLKLPLAHQGGADDDASPVLSPASAR